MSYQIIKLLNNLLTLLIDYWNIFHASCIQNSDKQLVLPESAMCADEDEPVFQDITKHPFFNTDNLWIRLDKLNLHGRFIPLPMIMNKKTADPKDDNSQKVLQLEPPWELLLNASRKPLPLLFLKMFLLQ
jgi:UDP-N-acetylglucosamine pyrophosphorylase